MRMVGRIHPHPNEPLSDGEFVTRKGTEGTVTGTTGRHSDRTTNTHKQNGGGNTKRI